jgi:hypothetical protein
VVPAAGRTTLARIQGWLHILGSLLFPAGIALVLVGGHAYIYRGARCRFADRGADHDAVCGRGVPQSGSLIPQHDRAVRIGGRRSHFQPHPWHSQDYPIRSSAPRAIFEVLCPNH